MKKPVELQILSAIIFFCDSLESQKRYNGNVYELAKEITRLTTAGLLKGQEKTLYNALTYSPMTTGEIAEKTGIPSKIVSTQLRVIYNKTSLIECTSNGKLKSWNKIKSTFK